jgi:hypothetical protein
MISLLTQTDKSILRGPKRDAVFVRLDPNLSDFFKSSVAIKEAVRRVMREMQSDARVFEESDERK